eukprot:1822853-Alexandrium_andersonii.AAC.1
MHRRRNCHKQHSARFVRIIGHRIHGRPRWPRSARSCGRAGAKHAAGLHLAAGGSCLVAQTNAEMQQTTEQLA